MEFGELTRVAVSEVWPHEAHHFTPWLGPETRATAVRVNACGPFCGSTMGKLQS